MLQLRAIAAIDKHDWFIEEEVMRDPTFRIGWAVAMLAIPAVVLGAAPRYDQVVDGVEVFLGIVPAKLVRDHAPAHPERQMHSGPPAGENHVMVALFDAKSGQRITDAAVHATITGPKGFRVEKPLEPMTIAGAASFGNYFEMLGAGPYRIGLRIRVAGATRDTNAVFSWTR